MGDSKKIQKRPETYSPWQFIAWVLDVREIYAIRKVTDIKDPDTGRWSQKVEILKLSQLPNKEFTYWAERWFMDPTTPIRTPDQWKTWEQNVAEQPEPF